MSGIAPEIQRFLRFALVSGAGWLLDVGITMVLAGLGAPYFVAAFTGALIAVLFVYVVSQRQVFSGRSDGAGALTGYLVWQAVAITAAAFAVEAAARLLEPLAAAMATTGGVVVADQTSAIAAGLGKVAVTPITLIANFMFMRWLLERRRSTRDTNQEIGL